MSKSKGTPDDLDYLFERDIIDEEDYAYFWQQYWNRNAQGRLDLVNEFLEIAADNEELTGRTLFGVVTKNKRYAMEQAKIIGGKMVRRNRRGQFSKRGTLYQAVRKETKKK
jgi:hypothetical protein